MIKTEFPEVAEYAKHYINNVTDNNILDALINGKIKMLDFIHSIPASKMDYSYALYKWTIKEVLAHVIDTERIMAYRALSISRGETKSLPGFDENTYVDNSYANDRKTESFIEEYLTVRDATLSLYKYMDIDAMNIIGTANKRTFSALSLGFVIAGHELHHINIIKERYLI
jgi:hypothetical protein